MPSPRQRNSVREASETYLPGLEYFPAATCGIKAANLADFAKDTESGRARQQVLTPHGSTRRLCITRMEGNYSAAESTAEGISGCSVVAGPPCSAVRSISASWDLR